MKKIYIAPKIYEIRIESSVLAASSDEIVIDKDKPGELDIRGRRNYWNIWETE